VRSEELRELQAPLKDRYAEHPEDAVITLSAEGQVGVGIACSVNTGHALVAAGLHPATGGDGLHVCSGDMLLQALSACAGVTLQAVATAFDIPIRSGTVVAEGNLDVRGTLGVDKEAPVGFRDIRLVFRLDTDADQEVLEKLITVTERYCVVLQTIRGGPPVSVIYEVAVA
jgi:uncharacterized OsmC-like protein